ncbi:MAG: DUF2721 domain-containing protein [Gemmatimonadaceae bacterium]|nr:DUF2721 domain-containing protein [Gemmatimonadaceae bacterium]
MPPVDPIISGIARVIQLSIAPVFLLTAVGALLGVFATRLSRVIDRARKLEDRLPHVSADEARQLHEDILRLGSRARLVNRSITLAVSAAICVCAIIATLFVGAEFTLAVERVVAVLFIMAMCALIAALMLFLREVFLSTRSLRFGPSR